MEYDENLPLQKLRWQPVRYIVRLENGSKYDPGYDAVDTIPVLAQRFNVDKILIVVQDTVLADKPLTYAEAEQQVRDMYMKFIEKHINVDLRKVELVVCPGVGDYSNRAFSKTITLSIDGEMYDFYAVLYVNLAKILSSISDSKLEVYVDLTHGVNYMPTLLYKAIRELLQLLAFIKKVQLYVYNSEPFIGEARVLNVHLVEKISLRPAVPPEICKDFVHLRARDESIKELAEKLKKIF